MGRPRAVCERYQIAYAAIWVLFGAALLVAFLVAWSPGQPSRFSPEPQYAVGAFGLLGIFAGLSYAFRLPAYRAFNILAATILALYVTALFLLGGEDVGGYRTTIPPLIAGWALALWSVLLAWTEPSD